MWVTKQRQEGLKMPSPENNSVLMGTPISQNCVLIWSPWESTTVLPVTAVVIKMGFWNFTQLKNSNKTYIRETFICQKHSFTITIKGYGAQVDDNDILPDRMQAEELRKEGITHCEEEKGNPYFPQFVKQTFFFHILKSHLFMENALPLVQQRSLKTKQTQVTTITLHMDFCMCMQKCICTKCKMPLPKISCNFWLGKAG